MPPFVKTFLTQILPCLLTMMTKNPTVIVIVVIIVPTLLIAVNMVMYVLTAVFTTSLHIQNVTATVFIVVYLPDITFHIMKYVFPYNYI